MKIVVKPKNQPNIDVVISASTIQQQYSTTLKKWFPDYSKLITNNNFSAQVYINGELLPTNGNSVWGVESPTFYVNDVAQPSGFSYKMNTNIPVNTEKNIKFTVVIKDKATNETYHAEKSIVVNCKEKSVGENTYNPKFEVPRYGNLINMLDLLSTNTTTVQVRTVLFRNNKAADHTAKVYLNDNLITSLVSGTISKNNIQSTHQFNVSALKPTNQIKIVYTAIDDNVEITKYYVIQAYFPPFEVETRINNLPGNGVVTIDSSNLNETVNIKPVLIYKGKNVTADSKYFTSLVKIGNDNPYDVSNQGSFPVSLSTLINKEISSSIIPKSTWTAQ